MNKNRRVFFRNIVWGLFFNRRRWVGSCVVRLSIVRIRRCHVHSIIPGVSVNLICMWFSTRVSRVVSRRQDRYNLGSFEAVCFRSIRLARHWVTKHYEGLNFRLCEVSDRPQHIKIVILRIPLVTCQNPGSDILSISVILAVILVELVICQISSINRSFLNIAYLNVCIFSRYGLVWGNLYFVGLEIVSVLPNS